MMKGFSAEARAALMVRKPREKKVKTTSDAPKEKKPRKPRTKKTTTTSDAPKEKKPRKPRTKKSG
jgi:hypothetical protein